MKIEAWGLLDRGICKERKRGFFLACCYSEKDAREGLERDEELVHIELEIPDPPVVKAVVKTE